MDAISIELEAPFITQACASKIVCTIVELLLYNRTQIPFPYPTFRAMVKKLETVELAEDIHQSVAEVRIQKQREKAQHMIKNVETLFDTLEKILIDHPAIGELMIVFGKTIYTAKEAFVVIMPTIDKNHFGTNHQRSLEKMLRKIGLQLTLCDQMVTGREATGDTNIFVALKSTSSLHPTYGVSCLDDFQLPKKCAKFVIILKTTPNGSKAIGHDCCKRLEVFSEEDMDRSPALSMEQ
uniref:Uncharacterized protein n=1 Tax=Anopheles epiroticus TaxID=199890 RepID=A0A182PKF0_9DIPT